jgi:hypothetical protein
LRNAFNPRASFDAVQFDSYYRITGGPDVPSKFTYVRNVNIKPEFPTDVKHTTKTFASCLSECGSNDKCSGVILNRPAGKGCRMLDYDGMMSLRSIDNVTVNALTDVYAAWPVPEPLRLLAE